MNHWEELEDNVTIPSSKHRSLLNSALDAQRLRKETEVLRASLASSEANVADLQADIDNLNAKVKVLKELIKEIANG
jgi:cell division protein FtsB